jgi:NAD(P)-dependent dehydrogenase (short-subunit alcohol dehydrogenase family)
VALRLATGGDRVIFVGRDAERGARVLSELRAVRPGVQHVYLQADLSLLGDTARVADAIADHTRRIDAVVCCAGVLSMKPEWTTEGLERTFVLNYLSRYLLSLRLLPTLMLAPSGRVVLVANAGKYADTLDFGDLQLHRARPGLHVSGQTQVANDLLAAEMAHRLRGTRVEVTCVYPGLARTSVFRNARGLPSYARTLVRILQPFIAMRPDKAAETPVYLAQNSRAIGISGAFFGPHRRQRPVSEPALQRDRRAVLWDLSHALVRDYLPKPCTDQDLRRIFVVARRESDEQPVAGVIE